NDPAAHAHDILTYYDAVELVKKYVDEHPNTVLISISDHECGGFSLARDPEYLWYPELVSRVKSSSFVLSEKLTQYWDNDREKYVRNNIIINGLGIDNATENEISWLYGNHTQLEYEYYLSNLT
ncbi:6998_t:CDS:2, partial [Funneliformis geosporum]